MIKIRFQISAGLIALLCIAVVKPNNSFLKVSLSQNNLLPSPPVLIPFRDHVKRVSQIAKDVVVPPQILGLGNQHNNVFTTENTIKTTSTTTHRSYLLTTVNKISYADDNLLNDYTSTTSDPGTETTTDLWTTTEDYDYGVEDRIGAPPAVVASLLG